MKFQKGNKLWQRRTKVGREVLFFDAQILWEEACKYFETCDSITWDKDDWVGKDAVRVTRKHVTPYTLSGLYLFLGGLCHDYFNNFLETKYCKENPEFIEVITRIRLVIETQQLEGGLVGAFDPRIVARLNGLTDKKDITSGGLPIAPPTVEVVSKQAADDLKKLKDL
jgi:hypothetical protein